MSINDVIDVTRDSHGQIEYYVKSLGHRVTSLNLSKEDLLHKLNDAIHVDGRMRRLRRENTRAERITRKGTNIIIADLWKEAVNRGLLSPYREDE